MLEFLFGSSRDKERAASIIRYLNAAFDKSKSFHVSDPASTSLKLFMCEVNVTISCSNKKINIKLTGGSDNNLEDHVADQVQRVRSEIRNYLSGSHAAKWRNRVTGI